MSKRGAIATAFKKLVCRGDGESPSPESSGRSSQPADPNAGAGTSKQTLSGIQSSSSDDCVRILTETGEQFAENRDRIRDIRTKLDDKAVALIREARRVVYELGPKLSGHPLFTEVEEHLEKLKGLLNSEEVIDQLADVGNHTKAMGSAYCSAYITLFDKRREGYEKAIEDLRNRPELGKVMH